MRFAVFVSGKGTNLQAIINAVKRGRIKAELVLVVTDNKKAYALKRAKKAKIKSVFINPKKFKTRDTLDKQVIKILKKEKVKFIILAGYMRILSHGLVRRYKNRILNIHPALLPSFRGAHAIKDAFDYGVKVTGVTIHLVDEKVDHGPIIMQEALNVKKGESLSKLEARIHKIEHRLYPKVIDLFARGKINVSGRKVKLR